MTTSRGSEEDAALLEAAVDALGELVTAPNRLQQPSLPSPPLPTAPAADRLREPPTDGTSSTTSSAPTTHQAQQDATKTHTKPKELERSAMSRTALLKELEALEVMIRVQERKLATLSVIRAAAMADETANAVANAPVDSSRHDAQQFEDAMERKLEALAATASQDHLMSPADALERAFDAHFVPKALLSVHQRAVDLKMMKLRATAHEELLVLALDDGTIAFYLSSGELLHRIDATAERRVVRAIELDLHSEVPTLAVLYSNPPIAAVYALELTDGGCHVMGTQGDTGRVGPTTAARSKRASSLVAQYELTVTEVSVIPLASEPTALAFAKTARRGVLTVASADGSLQFFAPNGTLLHNVATNASIRVLAAQRGRVAFSHGSDTMLLPLARGRDAAFVVCPGSAAAVSSVSFDPDHPELVYAGTSLGEVLVYTIRDSVHSSRDADSNVCNLVARTLVTGKTSLSPVFTTVRAMRGFVIAASDSVVSVHNISRSRDGTVKIETVCATATAQSTTVFKGEREGRGSSGAAKPFFLVVSEGAFVTNIAFVDSAAEATVAGPSNSHVRVFQSLLSTRSEKSDTSWVGVLFFGAIVVAVLGFQFFLCRQKQPRRGDPWDLDGADQSRRGAAVGADSPSRSPHVSGYRGKEQSGRFGSQRPNFGSLPHEVKAAMATRTARAARASASGGKTRGPPVTDRERFGASYDTLSEDLKRKIAEARRDTLECAFDSDEDDSS